MGEQFYKLPCSVCKLKTEHAKVLSPDGSYDYKCLRCGTARSQVEIKEGFSHETRSYPEDDQSPAGVG